MFIGSKLGFIGVYWGKLLFNIKNIILMDKRRKNIIIHNLLNQLDYIKLVNSVTIKKNEIKECQEEIIKLKEKAKIYIKKLNRPNVFLMSKKIGTPPFICRDLINNIKNEQ